MKKMLNVIRRSGSVICLEDGGMTEKEKRSYKNWFRVMAATKLIALAISLVIVEDVTIEDILKVDSVSVVEEAVENFVDYQDAIEKLYGEKDEVVEEVEVFAHPSFAPVLKLSNLTSVILTFKQSFTWIYGFSSHFFLRVSSLMSPFSFCKKTEPTCSFIVSRWVV